MRVAGDAARIEDAPPAAPHTAAARARLHQRLGRRAGVGRILRPGLGRLEMGDEGRLQALGALPRDHRAGRVGDEHPAGMHQRDAVAALRLVHEVGRDEDRHAVRARQVHEDAPERVARHRVDARGRLVEDQHLRLVDHRHGERQALAVAQRQRVGIGVAGLREVEARHHLLDARPDRGSGTWNSRACSSRFCSHRQLAVEREALRHVADAPARLEVVRLDLAAEQPGLPLARRQEPGQHLHRRRLAAAVRAEEAEDLAAADAERGVVDGREVAEPHRQVLRLDGGRRRRRRPRAAGSRPAGTRRASPPAGAR